MKTAFQLLTAAALVAGFTAAGASAQAMNQGAPIDPNFQLAGRPITHSYTSYSFNFTATSALTNLTFAFRDDPAFLYLDNVTLSAGSGPNLLVNGNFELGPNGASAPTGWTYLNQYGAASGGTILSGSGVGGSLGYRDGAVQAYDAITQGVATLAGTIYSVTFALNESSSQSLYNAVSTNNASGTSGNGINLAVYARDGIPAAAGAAPEPATWAMMILGFGLAGGVMRRRRRLGTGQAAYAG